MFPRLAVSMLLAAMLLGGCESLPDPAAEVAGDVAVIATAADQSTLLVRTGARRFHDVLRTKFGLPDTTLDHGSEEGRGAR